MKKITMNTVMEYRPGMEVEIMNIDRITSWGPFRPKKIFPIFFKIGETSLHVCEAARPGDDRLRKALHAAKAGMVTNEIISDADSAVADHSHDPKVFPCARAVTYIARSAILGDLLEKNQGDSEKMRQMAVNASFICDGAQPDSEKEHLMQMVLRQMVKNDKKKNAHEGIRRGGRRRATGSTMPHCANRCRIHSMKSPPMR